MSLRSVKAAVVAVVLGIVAAGCAHSPSTFATVNGETIRESTLDETAASVLDYFQSVGAPPQQTPKKNDVGVVMVQSEILKQYYKANGGEPSPKAIDKFISSNELFKAMAAHDDNTRAFTADFALLSLAPREKAVKLMQSAKVDINPRFGTWVDGQGPTRQSNSLSQLARGEGELGAQPPA